MFLVFPYFRLRISVFAFPIFLVMLWLEGYVPFMIIFLSAAVHELGHIAAMKCCGYNIRRIDILPMGALIVCPEGIPNRYEVIIALSGPLASLFLGCVSSLAFSMTQNTDFLFSAVINFVLGFFNLLPVKKLDGGKALYCYLEHKKADAERISFSASVFAKIIFVCFLGVGITASNFNWGVILLSLTLGFQLLQE